jgi:hypothetical protein
MIGMQVVSANPYGAVAILMDGCTMDFIGASPGTMVWSQNPSPSPTSIGDAVRLCLLTGLASPDDGLTNLDNRIQLLNTSLTNCAILGDVTDNAVYLNAHDGSPPPNAASLKVIGNHVISNNPGIIIAFSGPGATYTSIGND